MLRRWLSGLVVVGIAVPVDARLMALWTRLSPVSSRNFNRTVCGLCNDLPSKTGKSGSLNLVPGTWLRAAHVGESSKRFNGTLTEF